MKIQKLEPDQCSTMHVWDLSSSGPNRFAANLEDTLREQQRDAILVVGRDQPSALAALRKFPNTKFLFTTRAGGRCYLVRREYHDKAAEDSIRAGLHMGLYGVICFALGYLISLL
jgi:hypothetical protein